MADRDEVERMLRNLVRNAVEAMPDAGAIRIRIDQAAPDRCGLVIEDTGAGMDPETLRKALQPGFTTKESGSGLGLALVRRTVSAYGGTMRLESSPGRGTTVRIELPRKGFAPEPPVARGPGGEAGDGRPRADRG
jgi:signal transduction histidine kinase